MRVVLVDDERIARLSLRALLENEPGMEIVGEAGSGAEAVELIARCKPDAVFLDIQMPDESGFDVVARLASPVAIVFVSVSDAYALRAFEINALDYLQKPVQPERMRQTLQRLGSRVHAGPQPRPRAVETDLLFLAHEQGQLFVRADSLLFIESRLNNSRVFTEEKRQFVVRRSLNKWEEALDPSVFVRISRTVIVRVGAIKELSEGRVLLKNWAIPFAVSRRQQRRLRELLREAL